MNLLFFSQIDWTKFYNWQYLTSNQLADFKFKTPFLIILSVILVIAILIKIFSILKFKNHLIWQRFYHKIFLWFLIGSILGYFLLLARLQNIAIFLMRIWWLVLALGMIIWALTIIFYAIKKFPQELKKYENYLRKQKYLPKRKV